MPRNYVSATVRMGKATNLDQPQQNPANRVRNLGIMITGKGDGMRRRYAAYPQHLMQSHNYLFLFKADALSPNSRGQKHVKNPSPDPTPTQLFVLCADYNVLQWTTMTMNYNELQWIQITMNYNYNDYNGCYNGLQLQWTTMTVDYNGQQYQLQWLTTIKLCFFSF